MGHPEAVIFKIVMRLLGSLLAAACWLVLLGPLDVARAQEATPQAWRDMTVSVTTEWPGGKKTYGFGVVVGERNGSVYVATANHVVRSDEDDDEKPVKHEVEFYSDQGVKQPAVLLELYRAPPQDLAVLKVRAPWAGNKAHCYDVNGVKRGTPIWFIGRARTWWMPSTRGKINEAPDGDYLFDSEFEASSGVQVGSSGAPLLSAQGLLGIIVLDRSASRPRALSVTQIHHQFVQPQWNLPWSLPECPRPPPVPSVSWTCRAPVVHVLGYGDKGRLGGCNEGEFDATGWKQEAVGPAVFCAHDEPNRGHARTRSWCVVDGAELRLGMHNSLYVNGGYSDAKDCSGRDHCITRASYKVEQGGADLRIPPEAEGEFELWVDSVDCADSAGEGTKTAIVVKNVKSQIPLEVGGHTRLGAGLVQATLQGQAEKVSDWPGHKFEAHGRCEVTLSVHRAK